ncbi:NUDIX domain-containing protein [Mesobacillus selenatarsenatis]|uniref:MutT-like protein n=1 Tax=Mesobacillus selenatarsenatis (strain DSM 18680 / JCM 14380 / FERM P-15431 / SF-1) TaxID=1321606 RepID=A0A0A8X424_MESS1|nr:NUDIX domain-containing protein [Mesobacillus selenatarsenatis]GAM13994.1 MutT-like protein [Mesobacillus selenatarsenatis SF-1]
MITRQNNGFELIDFIEMNEMEMNKYHPLAGSHAIIEIKGGYLLGFNSLRQQWEVPAGKREKGETPLECAQRELLEETGQFVEDLEFIGLARVRNLQNETEKFNPIYYSSVDSLLPFQENVEMTEIRLWDLKETIHIDQVDLAILDYVSLLKLRDKK